MCGERRSRRRRQQGNAQRHSMEEAEKEGRHHAMTRRSRAGGRQTPRSVCLCLCPAAFPTQLPSHAATRRLTRCVILLSVRDPLCPAVDTEGGLLTRGRERCCRPTSCCRVRWPAQLHTAAHPLPITTITATPSRMSLCHEETARQRALGLHLASAATSTSRCTDGIVNGNQQWPKALVSASLSSPIRCSHTLLLS